MYSSFGVKIGYKTLKRYFIMRLLDLDKDIIYNKSILDNLLDEYHCNQNEKERMCIWFYNCWKTKNWEE